MIREYVPPTKDPAESLNVPSMSDDKKPDRSGPETTIGAAIAIGAGVGTALFAALDDPVWIGVGVAIGAGVGAALYSSKTDGDDD